MDRRLRVRHDESLRRGRLTTFLRALLLVPHLVAVAVWTMLVLPAAAIVWLVTLVVGRPPARLHRFLSAYLRYHGQVIAWFALLSGRYPNPLRTHGRPFAIELPERRPHPRLVTLLRVPLAVPALVLSSVFAVVLALDALVSWFAGITLGRATNGLVELGTFCLRYELETLAYVLLLTSSYPHLAPPELRTETG